MPISKRWSLFTLSRLRLVPAKAGIYELGDSKGEIVYIGSGDSRQGGVRSRINFHKKYKPKSVRYFRFMFATFFQSPMGMEQEHCELFVSKYGRLPRLQKRMPRGYLFRI